MTNGIIFCVCSILTISVLQFVLKRWQKEYNKIPPSTLSSSASESQGKAKYESQSPWSAKAEEYDGTVRPVVGRDTSHAPGHQNKQFVECSYSARYSGWDDDKAWSSQEWKADELMDDRTATPVVASWQGHTSSNQVSLMRRPSTLFWKKTKITTERGHLLSALKEE